VRLHEHPLESRVTAGGKRGEKETAFPFFSFFFFPLFFPPPVTAALRDLVIAEASRIEVDGRFSQVESVCSDFFFFFSSFFPSLSYRPLAANDAATSRMGQEKERNEQNFFPPLSPPSCSCRPFPGLGEHPAIDSEQERQEKERKATSPFFFLLPPSANVDYDNAPASGGKGEGGDRFFFFPSFFSFPT